jgi:hypothetical protein
MADFFNDASAKRLPDQLPNTDFLDQLAERKARLDHRFARARLALRVYSMGA